MTKKTTYYSTSEIAVMFAVQRATVFNWIKSGKLPNTQLVGKTYNVPHQDILKLIEVKIAEEEQALTLLKELYKSLSHAD